MDSALVADARSGRLLFRWRARGGGHRSRRGGAAETRARDERLAALAFALCLRERELRSFEVAGRALGLWVDAEGEALAIVSFNDATAGDALPSAIAEELAREFARRFPVAQRRLLAPAQERSAFRGLAEELPSLVRCAAALVAARCWRSLVAAVGAPRLAEEGWVLVACDPRGPLLSYRSPAPESPAVAPLGDGPGQWLAAIPAEPLRPRSRRWLDCCCCGDGAGKVAPGALESAGPSALVFSLTLRASDSEAASGAPLKASSALCDADRDVVLAAVTRCGAKLPTVSLEAPEPMLLRVRDGFDVWAWRQGELTAVVSEASLGAATSAAERWHQLAPLVAAIHRHCAFVAAASRSAFQD
jgi:hypothetical protein